MTLCSSPFLFLFKFSFFCHWLLLVVLREVSKVIVITSRTCDPQTLQSNYDIQLVDNKIDLSLFSDSSKLLKAYSLHNTSEEFKHNLLLVKNPFTCMK